MNVLIIKNIHGFVAKNILKSHKMRCLKERKDVDFLIQSLPLSALERKEVSEFIKKRKAKLMKNRDPDANRDRSGSGLVGCVNSCNDPCCRFNGFGLLQQIQKGVVQFCIRLMRPNYCFPHCLIRSPTS